MHRGKVGQRAEKHTQNQKWLGNICNISLMVLIILGRLEIAVALELSTVDAHRNANESLVPHVFS